MPEFVINFTNDITIRYALDTSILALKNWMNEIVKYDTSDFCKISHKAFTGNKDLILKNISLLYEAADILNLAYPGSIIKEEFFKGNEQDILNRMHVHFPNIHKNNIEKTEIINHYASRYNVLIHWLEKEFKPNATTKFSISIDIHKSPKGWTLYDLDKEDFTKFEAFSKFGDLLIGYPHVGRHAQEIYNARDLECPKEHYLPQSKISASCILIFRWPEPSKNSIETYLKDWPKFYNDRGGEEFFNCDINDPSIRFGSLKIGQLNFASIGNREININNAEGKVFLKKLLLTNDIISFTIKE